MKQVRFEQFQIVRSANGYRTIPANPDDCHLLRRLHGGDANVTKQIRLSLKKLLGNIERACASNGVLIEVAGEPGAPTCTLRDAIEVENATAVSLRAALKRHGIDFAARWFADGRIVAPGRRKAFTTFERNPSVGARANREAAAAHVASLYPDLAQAYFNLKDFLEKRGYETAYEFGRALYKYVGCGPWTAYIVPGAKDVYYEDRIAYRSKSWWKRCTGVRLGSIVEGSDVEVGPEDLMFPFTEADLDRAIEAIDNEVAFYWKHDNSDYYSIQNAAGEKLFCCQWVQFDDEPTGSFAEDDKEALALAIKAHQALHDPEANKRCTGVFRTIKYGEPIAIPGTEFFVCEEPTPDFCY